MASKFYEFRSKEMVLLIFLLSVKVDILILSHCEIYSLVIDRNQNLPKPKPKFRHNFCQNQNLNRNLSYLCFPTIAGGYH